MGEITFLRILVILTFWNATTFPWWVWLWAIVVEGDHMMNSFVSYRCDSLMVKDLENGCAKIETPGDRNTTPV
jgi:hypothetical protein